VFLKLFFHHFMWKCEPTESFPVQQIDSTYLAVQELVNGTWETVFVDADWETRFSWVDANARRSTKDANVITAVLDAVAKIMGVRFDYEKALQVAEEGNVDIRTIIRESMADTVAAKRRNKYVGSSLGLICYLFL